MLPVVLQSAAMPAMNSSGMKKKEMKNEKEEKRNVEHSLDSIPCRSTLAHGYEHSDMHWSMQATVFE
jgi:hypothetical protein